MTLTEEEAARIVYNEMRCSFCTKPRQKVRRLIAGYHANICERCVALCVETLADALPSPEDSE